jgi:hypothetical protein
MHDVCRSPSYGSARSCTRPIYSGGISITVLKDEKPTLSELSGQGVGGGDRVSRTFFAPTETHEIRVETVSRLTNPSATRQKS